MASTGTDLTMMRGLHIFRGGGAWELDDYKLIGIRDLAQEVLTNRRVPSAKVVHYIVETRLIGQGKAKKSLHYSACRSSGVHSRLDLTDDNSTASIEYVSCGNCKTTKAFKVASGTLSKEDADRLIIHFSIENDYRWGTAQRWACNLWQGAIQNSTGTIADVTCGNCIKTKKFKSRLEPIHETVDH